MLDLTLDKLFNTGGRFYDYIDQTEFLSAYKEQENKFTLDDLAVDGVYTFYRACKTDDNSKILFMKIVGTILELSENEMLFKHQSPRYLKQMVLSGYLEHWFFIPKN